jgi:hypothetical protein
VLPSKGVVLCCFFNPFRAKIDGLMIMRQDLYPEGVKAAVPGNALSIMHRVSNAYSGMKSPLKTQAPSDIIYRPP